MSFYQEVILDHHRNPRNYGRISRRSKTSTLYNPLCGDAITLDLVIENDVIKEVAFSGSGCVISQASASLLTERVKGKKISDLRKIDPSVILNLIGIQLGPVRTQCALLALKVFQKIINSI